MRAAQMITTVADWVRYFVFAWHGLEDKRENEVGGGGGGGVVQQLESAPPSQEMASRHARLARCAES
jgi:hypothetical protein